MSRDDSSELWTLQFPDGVELGGQREITLPRPDPLLARVRDGLPLTKDGANDRRQVAILKALRDVQALPVEYDAVVAAWEQKHGVIDLAEPDILAIFARAPTDREMAVFQRVIAYCDLHGDSVIGGLLGLLEGRKFEREGNDLNAPGALQALAGRVALAVDSFEITWENRA